MSVLDVMEAQGSGHQVIEQEFEANYVLSGRPACDGFLETRNIKPLGPKAPLTKEHMKNAQKTYNMIRTHTELYLTSIPDNEAPGARTTEN